MELVLKGDFPLSSISDQSFPGNKLRRGQKVFLVLTHVHREVFAGGFAPCLALGFFRGGFGVLRSAAVSPAVGSGFQE